MSICDRRRRAITPLFDRIAGHGKRNRAHLARVNSRAGEGVFVGSHLVAGVLFKATRCCVVDRGLAMAKVEGRDTVNFSNCSCVPLTNRLGQAMR